MTDDAARHISREGLAALEFYRDGLGLDTRGVVATEFTGDESTPAGAIAIFELADGLLPALYPRTELAEDANISIEPPTAGGFSIGHIVGFKADVDATCAAPSSPNRSGRGI